ncbi:MAG TPA: hypothetical protein VMN82_12700 [Thermoanaerobaculia bacterium]|nr:hypothetical protein [Thermoanaerobaculia bacterium]
MRTSNRRRSIGMLLSAAALAVSANTVAQILAPDRVAPGAWRTLWSAGGAVSALALDPTDPRRLYASTASGFFVSADGGTAWAAASGGPRNAHAIVPDSGDAARLFAATASGVDVSTDAGRTFRPTGPVLPIEAIALDPAHPGTVYAAGDGPFVNKSTDSGETWTRYSVQGLSRTIASLIIDPNHPETFYATGEIREVYDYPGYPAGAIFQSTDSGRTFQERQRDQSYDGGAASQVAVAPSGQLLAAIGGRIYRSDGGQSWSNHGTLGTQVSSIATDPLEPQTVYAGTDVGVFVTLNGYVWHAAPPLGAVTSLALDYRHRILYAGTSDGVAAISLPLFVATSPCVPDSTTLCFGGSRFQARLSAQDPRTQRIVAGTAVAQNGAFGYFSFPDLTGDATLPEVLVKLVDAEIPPWNSDWVFYGSLTDVNFVLTVTDTVNGSARVYGNASSAPYCGGADTAAFEPSPAPPGSTVAPVQSALAASPSLPLLGGRFRATLSAVDPGTGRPVQGEALSGGDRFGFFGLSAITGVAGLPEVGVKMLDATSFGHGYWLFETGLTSVAYTLTVLDTATNETRTYDNADAYCGVADTRAFSSAGAVAPPGR